MWLSKTARRVSTKMSAMVEAVATVKKPWVYRLIFNQWPQLRERIQAELVYAKRGRLDVLVSCLELPIWRWTYSGGGSLFLTDEQPDPYYACISQNRGNFDQLIVMWRIGARRFWFNNTWNVLIGARNRSLIQETGERFDQALIKWDESEESVVFSGDIGWLDIESLEWIIGERRVGAAEAEKAEEHMRKNAELCWKQ